MHMHFHMHVHTHTHDMYMCMDMHCVNVSVRCACICNMSIRVVARTQAHTACHPHLAQRGRTPDTFTALIHTGSPQARAAAKQRYAWANDGHVPDIIHKHAADNGNHELYESKVYTAASAKNNKGGGTAKGGGSPSTAAGHLVAFGCTEERLLVDNFGCKARGAPTDGAFNHDVGEGWVQAREGCYHDALTVKKNTLKLLIGDPHGGVTSPTFKWLTGLGKCATTVRDGTVYGEHSEGAFVAHHGACISYACVRGEADTFHRALDALERKLTTGAA